MSVLITGGGGFIGSHMSLLLIDQVDTVYSVVVIDDLSRGSQELIDRVASYAHAKGRSYTFVKGDIGDALLVQQTLVQHSVEAVVHFAGFAYASESVEQPLMYFDNTVAKTARLLSAMSAAGVSRLLYSSSSATYGLIDEIMRFTNQRNNSSAALIGLRRFEAAGRARDSQLCAQ